MSGGWAASLAPLRDRRYRLVFSANSLSTLGDQIVPVALAFAVLHATGSPAALGFVLLARTVPQAVFLLTGGVWADRLPRQRLMISSDLVRFFSQGVFAALLLSGRNELWWMLLLQAVHGTAGAFARPASGGLIAQLLEPTLRQRGAALMYTVTSSATIVGPAAAGLLLAISSPGLALAIDAATFLVSALLLAGVKLPPRQGTSERKHFAADLLEGWHEVRSHSWLWSWILNFAVFQFAILSAFWVLGPVVSQRSLGGDTGWAVISVGTGVGGLIGSVIAVRWLPRRPLVAMAGALILAPITLLGLAVPLSLATMTALAVLIGIAMSFGDAVWEGVLSNRVPEHLLSRVVSYDWMGSIVLRPIGLAIVGPIAAHAGSRTTLVGAAVLYFAATAVAVAMPTTWRILSPGSGAKEMEPA
ncbi:MFS transporter [Actinoplanes sp. NPDC051475]|uniref:MFS transporter n=1 Tax=Actinoplanes sp. NPDC051475 TaxID=3157225 RepID=UPI00344F2D58